jgi:hypothetical protein
MSPESQREAALPDLIGVELSPKNAAWLVTQQIKAEQHGRLSAAARNGFIPAPDFESVLDARVKEALIRRGIDG